MTPFDFATHIVRIDLVGFNFVVALADDHWRLVLSMSPSAQRADQVALLARQIVAREIARALADEDCRIAAEVDQRYLAGEMYYPSEVSKLCRELAQLHTIELHSRDGQTDRLKPG
jgi:hypothetical protein